MFEITQVTAYKTKDGIIVLASEIETITAYQTGDGTLYDSRDAARLSLVTEAIKIVGEATGDVVNAAAANANTDEAQKARYAILYLAAIMQGAA